MENKQPMLMYKIKLSYQKNDNVSKFINDILKIDDYGFIFGLKTGSIDVLGTVVTNDILYELDRMLKRISIHISDFEVLKVKVEVVK